MEARCAIRAARRQIAEMLVRRRRYFPSEKVAPTSDADVTEILARKSEVELSRQLSFTCVIRAEYVTE
jgi:hypothetical protein